jgi:hypothetical protein
MAARSEELAEAVEAMRDELPIEIVPVLDALVNPTDDAQAEEVWRSIITEVLDEG